MIDQIVTKDDGPSDSRPIAIDTNTNVTSHNRVASVFKEKNEYKAQTNVKGSKE